MSEKLEALWIVEVVALHSKKSHFKIFRSRKAAREYRTSKQKRAKSVRYLVPRRATWGPE